MPPGTVLNGRYETIKPIARGGFSFVYLCQHLRNGRLLAVKEAFGDWCVREGLAVEPTDPAMFDVARAALLREVSAISRINHPGVVRFEDVFEENGTLCFAMDFIEGETLAELLKRRGSVSPATFEPLANALLDAVDSLHANDVLHGDIKPGNLFVRQDKSIVIVDFGTAGPLADIDYPTPIVSPGYSAPERYGAQKELGAWTDVYSCAATLSAALLGAPPPAGEAGDIQTYLDQLGAGDTKMTQWKEGLELGLHSGIRNRASGITQLRAAMGLALREQAQTDAVPSDGRSIFISYARKDRDSVESFVHAVQREGTGVWIDRQGIAPGSPAWGAEIVKGMRGAEKVLLFSSESSMASETVKDEIYLARELGKPIIVARLDEAPFNDDVMMFLMRTQHIPVAAMEPRQFAATIRNVLNGELAVAA